MAWRGSVGRAVHRPVAKVPFANGPPLEKWPRRVAVVAYGLDQNYGCDDLLMTDSHGQTCLPGQESQMSVACPADLEKWACANQVRIPKSQMCVVVEPVFP